MEKRNLHRTKPLSCKKKRDSLECKPPIHLHTFPGLIKYKQLREAWIKAVRREPIEKKGSWQPALRDRVWFIHFCDRLATDENPILTLFLGNQSKEKKSRRILFRKPLAKMWGKFLLHLPLQLLKMRKYPSKQIL